MPEKCCFINAHCKCLLGLRGGFRDVPNFPFFSCYIFINFDTRNFSVRKQLVNIPSFIVRLDSQKHIDFALRSPFGGGRAGRVKRKNMKKGQGGAEAEEDDE